MKQALMGDGIDEKIAEALVDDETAIRDLIEEEIKLAEETRQLRV
jgi:hypothetical protein